MIFRSSLQVFKCIPMMQRACRDVNRRTAATYEGEGKTNARVLNKDLDYLMINSVSNVGFLLNAGFRILGPAILFPRTFMAWNISGASEINEKSLSLFTVLSPKIELLVIGFGNPKTLSKDQYFMLRKFSIKYNMGCEVLPTENAVATFNYLNHERRLVAGAFIPPTEVELYKDEDVRAYRSRQKLLEEDQSFVNM